MPGRDQVAANLAAIWDRVERAGGDPAGIELVAVTKGRSLADCGTALQLGVRALGENRVQEGLAKMAGLPEPEWHLIGHLQGNKVRAAHGRFALIQSVDSEPLAEALAERGPQAVLVQVNVARETAKHGVAPEAAAALIEAVASRLELRGLMGMAPREGAPGPAFRELRRLRDAAEQRLGRGLPVLSMGMSDDLEEAVRAGSTMLRVGRALFGSAPDPARGYPLARC